MKLREGRGEGNRNTETEILRYWKRDMKTLMREQRIKGANQEERNLN